MTKANTRKLSASLEDYLEAILNLSAKGSVARSKDIAELLGVSRASVTGALRTLSEKHLVNYKPYGFVTLTEEGRHHAQRVARKHEIIKSFFVDVLDVDETVAQEAACKAEHAFGPHIVDRLLNFMEFVSRHNGDDLPSEFKKFCRLDKAADRGGDA